MHVLCALNLAHFRISKTARNFLKNGKSSLRSNIRPRWNDYSTVYSKVQ